MTPIRLCVMPRCGNQPKPGKARSKRWAMTRKAVLARDPICKVCDDALSTEVDHIKPLSEGGDPYRLEGLQGICSRCHWAKTARESGKGKGRVERHGAYS